jgi:hypothetical protein
VCNDFLRAELNNDHETIRMIDRSVNDARQVLHQVDFIGFCKYEKLTRFSMQKLRVRLDAKYGRLRDSCAPLFPADMDNRIMNMSSHVLSETEKQALCLGLDFCIAPKRAEQIHINAAFENLYQQLHDVPFHSTEGVPAFKADLVSTAAAYGHTRIERSALLPCHIDALSKLKKDPSLLLLKPDKGAGVVIMDKRDYVSKVESLLNDPSKFKLNDRQADNTSKVTKSLRDILKSLERKGVITQDLCLKLTPTTATVPRLYGLPKTHKAGVPVRPILSMTGTAYERVSKWLVTQLKPVEEFFSAHCTRDSFSFVDNIKNLDVSSTKMASYDVRSLFTNVPVVETIDIIVDAVSHQPELCPLPPDVLGDLLVWCTTNVQFLFDERYYTQCDGVAMGSPLGCLFANVFMGSIEKKLAPVIRSFCKLYTRYVDDTFVLLRNSESALHLLAHFNSVHPNLHFTCEQEQNDSLPFLDVLVQRSPNGHVVTKVHRKPSFVGVYLNFHSFVPISYKRGLVRTLFVRAVRICSPIFLEDECVHLRSVLKVNGYPDHFIDMHQVLAIPFCEKSPTVEKKPVYLRLPFYGDKQASHLVKAVSTIFGKHVPAARPVFLFNTTRIPQASPKDRLPPTSTSSPIVYKFVCDCGAAYIGRTSRPLAVRSSEHVPKWLRSGRSGMCRTAISEHLLQCDCDRGSALKRFQIIARCQHERLMRILEALFIRRDRPALCKQKTHVMDLRLPW